MKKQTSAGIVVYHKELNGNLEYLLLQYTAGHWDFPKGKLEIGETKHDAAVRELEEETGIKNVTIHRGFEQSLLYTFNDFRGAPVQKTVTFFVGSVSSKDVIVLSHEHKGYVWLAYEQAVARLTYDNAKDVLRKAHDFLITHKIV